MTTADKERIEKEAEDIMNEHYKKKLEAEAEAYADSVDRRGCSFWRGLKLGYLAGKQSEHERSQQELQAYRDIIKELIPIAQWGYDLLVPFDKNGMGKDWPSIIQEAKKLIDTVTPT